MRFPTPLIPAKLIKRYKRFLADVVMADGSQITAHVANPARCSGSCSRAQGLAFEVGERHPLVSL